MLEVKDILPCLDKGLDGLAGIMNLNSAIGLFTFSGMVVTMEILVRFAPRNLVSRSRRRPISLVTQ